MLTRLAAICTASLGLAIGTSATAQAADAAAPPVNITWGGYVKLDLLLSRFSDAPVPQGTGRDFYVPNAIPVAAAGSEHARSYLDFHAKETRLFVRADGEFGGEKITAYVETDFISNQGTLGSEAVTNAYNLGLRRAYVAVGEHWLLGQDWSTFQNLNAMPEMLDFVNFPTDGNVFVRQPQVRYSCSCGLVLALENPETTVAAFQAATGNGYSNTDDNVVPDLVVRYNLKAGFADLAFAALARQLTDRGSVGGADDQAFAYGLSFSGKLSLGPADDIRFMFNGGKGTGRYLAINTVGDAVVNAQGKLDPVGLVNGYIVYRHAWTQKLRSNLALSGLRAATDTGAESNLGPGYTRRNATVAVNLLYSPFTPKLTLGGELRYARRDTVGEQSGNLARLQLSAKYAF